MQVEFNPKDSNTFASASLDRSVKVIDFFSLRVVLSTVLQVWGLNSTQPHFSLEGHERGQL
jgi:coatomer subunit beta'